MMSDRGKPTSHDRSPCKSAVMRVKAAKDQNFSPSKTEGKQNNIKTRRRGKEEDFVPPYFAQHILAGEL